MTTELAIAAPNAPVPMTIAILDDLRQQAEALQAANAVAEWICGTAFAPQAYRGKPKEGAVAILYGARLGLDAIQSLQNVFTVHGTPNTYAKVMKAAVLAAGHEVWTVEKSATRCVVRARRKGTDPSLPPEESVWDIERVRTAGYDKSNAKYRTEPQNMLYARATAEVCRAVAPDVLLGIDVDVEEAHDHGQPIRVESERVSIAEALAPAAEAPPVVVQQWQPPASDEGEKPEAAQVGEPARDTVAEAVDPEPARKVTMASIALQRKLSGLLDRFEVTDKADKFAFMAKALERPIVDGAEVTKAEALELIADLERQLAEDQAKTAEEPPAADEQAGLPIEGAEVDQ